MIAIKPYQFPNAYRVPYTPGSDCVIDWDWDEDDRDIIVLDHTGHEYRPREIRL